MKRPSIVFAVLTILMLAIACTACAPPDFTEQADQIKVDIEAAGITVPVLPGIMPVYSVKMMEMLAGLCGATITDDLRQGIAALPEDDKAALNDFGIEFATAQCRELLEAGVVGLHIYTMDRSSSAVGIVNRLRAEGLL